MYKTKGKCHLEDPNVKGNKFNWLFKRETSDGVELIYLAQNRGKHLTFVYKMLNIGVISKAGHFWTNQWHCLFLTKVSESCYLVILM